MNYKFNYFPLVSYDNSILNMDIAHRIVSGKRSYKAMNWSENFPALNLANIYAVRKMINRKIRIGSYIFRLEDTEYSKNIPDSCIVCVRAGVTDEFYIVNCAPDIIKHSRFEIMLYRDLIDSDITYNINKVLQYCLQFKLSYGNMVSSTNYNKIAELRAQLNALPKTYDYQQSLTNITYNFIYEKSLS